MPVKLSSPLIQDTPGVIMPEVSTPFLSAVASSVRQLRALNGVISAWLDPIAFVDPPLGERDPHEQIAQGDLPHALIVVLCEPGHEGSLAVESPAAAITITLIGESLLRDALEWDEELAAVIAHGYRLCGPDREAFEMESLAKEIALAVGSERLP